MLIFKILMCDQLLEQKSAFDMYAFEMNFAPHKKCNSTKKQIL